MSAWVCRWYGYSYTSTKSTVSKERSDKLIMHNDKQQYSEAWATAASTAVSVSSLRAETFWSHWSSMSLAQSGFGGWIPSYLGVKPRMFACNDVINFVTDAMDDKLSLREKLKTMFTVNRGRVVMLLWSLWHTTIRNFVTYNVPKAILKIILCVTNPALNAWP